MFNKDLDIDQLAKDFAVDNRLRIKNVFDPAFAEATAGLLETGTSYATILTIGGQGRVLAPSEIAALNPDQQQELHTSILRDAAAGVGYFYNGHQIPESRNQKLRDFLSFVNAPQSIEFIRKLTGSDEITHADGQATQYHAGHFLTRHSDNIQGESRRFAYVFGFTRNWHPDWGGLLQFYEPDGTPRDAWLPAFNTLSIFDVRHIHSVTYVTPFASGMRHSITGWFRV